MTDYGDPKKLEARFFELVGGEVRGRAALAALKATRPFMVTKQNLKVAVLALEKSPQLAESINGVWVTADKTEVGKSIKNIVEVLGPIAAPKPATSSPPARTTPPAPAPAKPQPLSAEAKKEKASRLIGEYQRLEGKARAAFVQENFAALQELGLSKTLLNYIRANLDIPVQLRAGVGVTAKNVGEK